MPTKFDARQSVLRTALDMVGSAANDSLDTIFPKIDAELAKLFEDRNILLADGGLITYSPAGTSVSFSQALTLHVNSQIAGGAPTVISLGSTSRAFTASGRMLYAVINRSAGTATVTADATTLPTVVSANQEVVLIAKRVDSADGSVRLLFRNGEMFFAGQAKRLGTADFLQQTVANDAAATGAQATLAAPTTGKVRITNASLVSISGIAAGISGQSLIVENATGNPVQLLNDDTGATAADRILTGSGTASLPNQSSFIFTYDTTNSRWMLTGGSGSGSGGGVKNYVTNPTAEANAADYSLYLDAAGAAPVDGTGGSPVGVTFTRTTTTPLRGLGSFELTKDAVNRQGTGVSTDFVIDRADRAKVLQISFDYQLISGTFNAGIPSADSDFTVWIYDKTNGVMIQPTTFKVFSNSTTIPNQFISNFQTASNSVDYRLIFHIGTTSAAAWSMMLDTVAVSPTQYQYNTLITDWQPYTPTLTGFGGAPTGVQFIWRRVGSSIEVIGKFIPNSPTGVEARASLPPGLVSATSPILTSIQSVGLGSYTVATDSQPRVLIEPNVGYFTFGYQSASQPGLSKANGNTVSTSGNTLQFFATAVPIQGWSVQQQTSDVNDQRAVVWTARGNAQYLLGAYGTPIKFDVTEKDTHAGWNPVTHCYTVQVPGDYLVMMSAWDDGGGTTNWNVYKNQSLAGGGTPYAGLGSSTNYNLGSGSYVMADLKVGDILHFAETSGSQYVSAYRSASITKIGSPSQISATETIAAAYWASANQTPGPSTPVNFDSKEYDTHGAVTTGSGWKFTAPMAGFYQVDGWVNVNAGFFGAGLIIYKNGSAYKTVGLLQANGSGGYGFAYAGTLRLNAGEYIDLRATGAATSAGNASLALTSTTINIRRVGI